MALGPCRECGEDASTLARVCQKCGVPWPTGIPTAPVQKKENGFMVFAFALFLLFLIVHIFTSSGSPDPNTSAESSQPTASQIVFAGNRGQLSDNGIGCTDEDSETELYNAISSADVAHDAIGRQNAINSALDSGCPAFQSGDGGLVIDQNGFLEGYNKLRMDKDSIAYWFPRNFVEPIPGQPNVAGGIASTSQ
jgi:hypothetical protein